jgi:hypothetical protein
MQVKSSFGENERFEYTFIPPDRGMLVLNSSITIAPHGEIMPAITQTISAIPGLPLSLKIDAGVEKILIQH